MEEWVKKNPEWDKPRPKVVLVPAARILTKAAPPKATQDATADPPEEARRQNYNAADSDDSEDRDQTTQPSQQFAGMLLGVAKAVTYYSPAEWTDEAPKKIAKTPDEQLTPNDQDDFVEAKGERRQRTEDDSDESARKSARLAGDPPFPDMGPQAARNTQKCQREAFERVD